MWSGRPEKRLEVSVVREERVLETEKGDRSLGKKEKWTDRGRFRSPEFKVEDLFGRDRWVRFHLQKGKD